jgi:hypothetical protein
LLAAIGAGTARPGTLKTTMTVRGISAGTFSFGGGAVDSAASRYFLADRTNKALDVFDTRTLTQVAQIKDNFAPSGPNAVIIANGNVYVTSAGKVHVINESTLKREGTISIADSRSRTDAGCFDHDDNLLMVTAPYDAPPFVAWISTRTNAVYARLTFDGTAKAPTAVNFGGCVYDSGTKKFYLNNSGSTKHPRGELDVITAKSVLVKAPVVSGGFSQRQCGSRGLAFGAKGRLFIACESAAGVPGQVLFMSTDGKILKTLTTTGGGDGVAYDTILNRYYCACFDRWSTGITGAGNVTPVLGIVDGATMKTMVNAPTRPDASSVSVDPKTQNVFVPVARGINVYSP